MNIKVIQKEKSVVLKTKDFKLVASEPSIQPFHTYVLRNKDDIFHFYYTLEMYRKPYKGKWEKIASSYVYEFGIMPRIAEFLEKVLEFDVIKFGNKEFFNNPFCDKNADNDEFEASRNFVLSGMLNEDRIEITKTARVFNDCRGHNEFEFYNVNIAIGGNELGTTPFGVSLIHLNKKDIQQIILFASLFMEYAISKTQKSIEVSLNDDKKGKYNYPKIVKDHLKSKYNIEDWKPIFLKLYSEEYIFEEYLKFITGKITAEDLKCHEWFGEKRKMSELLNTMKDYEAYIHVLNDNRKQYASEQQSP